MYLNFQPLDVVSRYRDPQPQVVENYSYLFNCDPPREKVPPRGFLTIIYDVNKI